MENLEVNEFEIEQAPEYAHFVVDNDQKADWAMRKLSSVRGKQATNKAIFDKEVARVTEWLSTVNANLDTDAVYFEAVLTPYALTERSAGRKSLVLPHGTVKTTAGRPKIEFESEEGFIEWAKVNDPALLRIKTEIDKKTLNELITDDLQVISTQGEIIPSVKVLPAETKVSFVTDERESK